MKSVNLTMRIIPISESIHSKFGYKFRSKLFNCVQREIYFRMELQVLERLKRNVYEKR